MCHCKPHSTEEGQEKKRGGFSCQFVVSLVTFARRESGFDIGTRPPACTCR
jgi:hypothetical protein